VHKRSWGSTTGSFTVTSAVRVMAVSNDVGVQRPKKSRQRQRLVVVVSRHSLVPLCTETGRNITEIDGRETCPQLYLIHRLTLLLLLLLLMLVMRLLIKILHGVNATP